MLVFLEILQTYQMNDLVEVFPQLILLRDFSNWQNKPKGHNSPLTT